MLLYEEALLVQSFWLLLLKIYLPERKSKYLILQMIENIAVSNINYCFLRLYNFFGITLPYRYRIIKYLFIVHYKSRNWLPLLPHTHGIGTTKHAWHSVIKHCKEIQRREQDHS